MQHGPLHSLRRRSQRLLVGAVARLSPRRGELIPIEQVDWTSARRVLLIRPNFRMGNLMITTTALPILRANLPTARIDMLCAAGFSPLLANHPDLDRLHTFTRGVLLNPWRLWRLMRRVRRERYDIVIDATMTGSAALLTRWAGGHMRIGAGSKSRHFAFTSVVEEPPRGIWRVEAMRRYFGAMDLTVPEDAGMGVHLTDAEQAEARERMHGLGWEEPTWVTGIFVGARDKKVWPAERWGELITRLWESRATDEGLVVFHGDEEIGRRIGEIRRRIPAEVPISYSPGIRRFAALAAQCRQFITTDTGPMHLACAVGVPVVSLFFRRSWRRFAPQRPVDEVVFNPDMPSPEEVLAAHRRQRERLARPGADE